MALDLAELGITIEELQDRVVKTICDRLDRTDLSLSHDEEDDSWHGPLFDRLVSESKKRLDQAIDDLADQTITPCLEKLVSQFTLQATNEWGEKKGEPVTFTQYLVQRAEAFMTQPVDHDGKATSSYGKKDNTRIVYLIDRYLQYHIENSMKQIVGSANEVIAKAINETCRLKMDELAKSFKLVIGQK